MLIEKLKEIKKSTDNRLEKKVAEIIINKVEEYADTSDSSVKSFFKELFQQGCVSGMISELIYYEDTEKFYDKFYKEIEDLIYDWEEETGETVTVPHGDNRKNYLAWWGFERMAMLIADKLELEL